MQTVKLIGKGQNRFQRGDRRHFPYPDVHLFEPVLYLDPASKFPETTRNPGYFVGFADNVGDALTFKHLRMT
jgi:hypothetical protein